MTAETAAPTTAAPTTGPTSGSATATRDGTAWDCAGVEQARQDLADATNAELERMEVDRSDPRAFSVQVIVAARRGLEYWTTVREAIPDDEAELLADADIVVEYWTSVDADLDTIDVGSGDEAALAAATTRYLEVMAAHPEVEVLPVQERLTAGVDAACEAPTS